MLQTHNLSEDQQEIFDSYKNGENIFVTGPGGCGKSFLIKHIVHHAETFNKKISITALTGCASILLGKNAKTLHSWSGIGLAKADDSVITMRIEMNKYKKRNWLKTQILIIDEVSMMSKRLFNLLDHIGKKIRKSSKPFGGIQVIFCGDFYQLPPVGNEGDPDSFKFCFHSDLWDETFDSQYILDKSYRQTDDVYIEILNQIREGNLDTYYYNILKKRVNAEYPVDTQIKPVILHPTKRNVDIVNKKEMEKLTGEIYEFQYKLNIQLPNTDTEEIMNTMTMKLLKNKLLLSSFNTSDTIDNNKEKNKHKDNNNTISNAITNAHFMNDIYKIKDVENIYYDKTNILKKIHYLEENGLLSNMNSTIKHNEPKYPTTKQLLQTLKFIEKNSHFTPVQKYKIGSQVMCTKNLDMENGVYNGSVGIIQDVNEGGVFVHFNNGFKTWIGYHSTHSESLPHVEFLQIPLILAWAITIHKSQGATLNCAEINVGSSVFAEGQTYVALSRVRSLDGLYLKSLDKKKIKVNSDVVKFYERFYD